MVNATVCNVKNKKNNDLYSHAVTRHLVSPNSEGTKRNILSSRQVQHSKAELWEIVPLKYEGGGCHYFVLNRVLWNNILLAYDGLLELLP